MLEEFLKTTTIMKKATLETLSGWTKSQINPKELCLCIVLNFCVWSTIGALLPYLPVFYRSIGLSAEQVGFVIALKSLVGGISCVFWGAFADKFKMRKGVFIVSMLAWALFAVSMTVVPPNEMFKDGKVQGTIELERHEKAALMSSAVGASEALNNVTKCFEHDTALARLGQCSSNNANGYSAVAGGLRDNNTRRGTVISPSNATAQTFLLSLLSVSLWSFFGSASAPLLDDIIFRVIPKDQNTYGRFRSVGSLGYGVAALVVGFFVKDYILSNKTDVILTPDYRPAFYSTMASSMLSIVAVLFIDLNEQDNGVGPVTPKIPMLQNKRLLSVLGTVFCLGMCHNMIQNFLLWYVEDIDGSHVCMGLIVLTEHLSEIPFFFFGEHAIKLFGHTRLISCACIVYAFRFLSYSLISSPWLILPLEIGNGITLGLMWASAASYVSLMTPVKHQATTLGLLGGLHFQLGHFLSAIFAGELITHAGFRIAWWIYAAFILLVGALFVAADAILPQVGQPGSYEELEGHVVVGEVPGYNAEEYQADAEYQDASYNNEDHSDNSPTVETRGVRGVENEGFTDDVIPAS